MNSQLPTTVRTTAAAMAVFMTMATLSSLVSFAEPQQSQLIAKNAAHQTVQMAVASPRDAIVALAPIGAADH